MCKNGQPKEAYELAKTDYSEDATNIWNQRKMGWAIYYLIKDVDNQSGNYTELAEHIDEMNALDQLTVASDAMIFDNVQLQIGTFVRNHINPNDGQAASMLSELFHKLKDYTFTPSLGHSILLQSYIKHNQWQEMADFIDWWNLDLLRQPDDYQPYTTQNGHQVVSLAERAYMACAKALLKQDDLQRVEDFLPRMDAIMSSHPQMIYLGYFYGKLLLKFGSNTDEALKVIMPFARKKATEFWVWQLLAEAYAHNQEKQLACLLRAVHCHTQETFLGKVRIKLVALYLQMNQPRRAKHHFDAVAHCYNAQGWRLPAEIADWARQDWTRTVAPDGSETVNYMEITNQMLCDGTEEAIAIVTHVDRNTHKATIVYGMKRQAVHKFRTKVGTGAILKINYITEANGKIKIFNTENTRLSNGIPYIKSIEGTVDKQDGKNFAFLKSTAGDCFVAPDVVKKFELKNREHIKALAVYDYNKNKATWNWVCVSVKR